MLESNNLVTFEGLANSSSYHTFLLDEEKGRLVVGAKDHIFSFNLLNIRDYVQVHLMSEFSISLSGFFFLFVNIYAFTPKVRLFLTDFKCEASARSASQELRYLGTFCSVSTQKCLMHISDPRPFAHDHMLCQDR